jgi:choline monooxygenase
MHRFLVDPDITKASTIHKDFYLDNDTFETLRHKLFPFSWQFVADANVVFNAGDLWPFQFLEDFVNEPLMLTKNNEQTIHCLSNVCTHRGNLLAYDKCNAANGIVCKYHGRRFDLNGQFKSMPEFKEVKNFPSERDSLHHLPLMTWGNLLFTHMASQLLDYFSPMKERLAWLPISSFVHRSEFDKDYIVNCNWALYCENYLEGFHIPFVHEGLNAAIDYGTYETVIEDKCILQIGYSKHKKDCFDLPTASVDFGKNIAAYYYWVYPNMMFNFYPWGLSLNIIKPVAIDKTKVSFLVFIWDESKYNHGAGSDLDKVEMEDEEVVQNVQKGIRSRFYEYGRYAPQREQGTHHFHRLMAEALQAL